MRFGRLLLAVLLAGGCATGQSRTTSATPDREVITQQDIDDSQSLNAYDMIRSLRPRWLSQRGVASMRSQNPVILYVNDNRVGSIDRLREYAPRDLSEVRYLDANQATQRFGTGHRSGAILLYLRRGSY